MTADAIFSGRLLLGWIVAAVLLFVVSLYLMGSGGDRRLDTVGPNTYSHSAIGYAGIADVLRELGISVVKSRSNSLDQMSRGSVLVIAEPRPGGETERIMRALLKADTILLVLPKWFGRPSTQKPQWLGDVLPLPASETGWALHLVAPRADVLAVESATWAANGFNLTPDLEAPINLMHGDRLRPLIAAKEGILLGELTDRNRRIWVLSDPDLISNQGLARTNDAALAVAIIQRLRTASGSVVFDETVHGFVSAGANPLLLLFRFPFVMATIQGAIAVALLLWATLGRFGAAQPAPPPMSAGRQRLLQNIAKLVEFTGHQEVMVRRYVLETVRDVARQLHAPRGLSTAALIAWLQRVGAARGVETDCGALIRDAEALHDRTRRTPGALVRLARLTHRWKGEIIDGPARHPLAR